MRFPGLYLRSLPAAAVGLRSLPGIQEPSGVGLEGPPSLIQDLLLFLGTALPPQHVFKVCARAQESVLADSEIDKNILIMF